MAFHTACREEPVYLQGQGGQGQWDGLAEWLGGPSAELLTDLPCRKEA